MVPVRSLVRVAGVRSALRLSCAAFVVLILCPMSVALAAMPAADDGEPDAVCFPVMGRGTIVTPGGVRLPIGSLSAVMSGDRVQVDSGYVVVSDFRLGTRRRVAAGGRFQLPEARHPKPPSTWELLRQALAQAIHGPDELRQGGAVRGSGHAFWPDTAYFAPTSAIVFRWRGACPAMGTIRLRDERGDSAIVALDGTLASEGGVAWPATVARTPGRWAWSVHDEDGVCVGGGRFEILTEAQAADARGRYLEQAERKLGAKERDLGAALMAAEDRRYLW